jgi:hypothetical protein
MQQRDEVQTVEAAQAQEGAALEREQRIVIEDIAQAMVLPYRDVIRERAIVTLADACRRPKWRGA